MRVREPVLETELDLKPSADLDPVTSAQAGSSRDETVTGAGAGKNGKAGDGDLRQAFDALVAGSSEALGEIYELLGRELYGLALWRTGHTGDAEDVVQDVFVRLAKPGLDLGRVRDPRAYLLTMARRSAVDKIRQKRKAEHLDDVPADLLVANNADPTHLADARIASRCMQRLSLRQREVVFLREYAGLSFRQIGIVMGIPTFTAASRHRLAIFKLRKWMGVEI